MKPYTELELINLIAAFEETLTTLVTPALIEEKKRDIAELKAMHAAMMAEKDTGE